MDSSLKSKGIGTWHRYKLGQAQFTSWLKKTAGKLASSTPTETEHPEPGKLSRRQKKKAQVDPSLTTIALEAEAKSVHWSQLEILAQRVVDSATPDEIPTAAISILRDVVSLRKKSYRFFSSALKNSADEKTKQSNASHAHIIGVLERVLAKLEAFMSTARNQTRTKTNQSAPIDISQLSNMFSYLEVADTAASGIDNNNDDGTNDEADSQTQHSNKKSQRGSKKGAKKTKKQQERLSQQLVKKSAESSWVNEFDFGETPWDDEEDEFDLYMMVYCFFVDFNEIRNYVRERWCDYWYDRSVSFDTLAVITNAAFELFHKLEINLTRQLRQLHPKLAEYQFMMQLLFMEYGLEHIDYDELDNLSPEEMNDRIWRDEADWLAFGSYATVTRLLEFIPPGQVPTSRPSTRTAVKYGANDNESWDKFQMNICLDLTAEMASLVTMKGREMVPPFMPAEPQLFLDLQEMVQKRKYTSAIIFSLHLWTDIRNIIEEDVVRPFEQLRQTAAGLVDAFDKHDPDGLGKNRHFGHEWRARMEEAEDYMIEDFTLELKTARFRKVGILDEDPVQHTLLKYDPVWPGLLDFRAKLVESQMGHQFTMLTCVLEAAAYLYHAALATGAELPGWEMMSKYVDTYNKASKFRRGLEGQSGAAIINNFQGVLNTYHRVGRAIQTTETTDGGRTFTSAVNIRMTLYDRYGFDDKQDFNRLDYLENIVKHQLEGERESLAEGGDDADGTSTALVRRDGNQDKLIRRQAALWRLSPVETLQLLDRTVTSQLEGLLTLDYLGLYDESIALLEAVSDTYGPGLKLLGYDDTNRPHCYGSLLVGLGQVLRKAAGTKRESEIMNTLVELCRKHLAKLKESLDK